MNNTPDPLDEVFYVTMADGFTQGGTLTEKSKRQIQELIEQQVLIGRIEELDKMQELGKDNVTTFQGIIKFRLTALKAQLKG
jgi:hypothetical protein